MSRASTAAEPSMEEILASIRRIIADEDPAAKAARPAPPAEALPEPFADEPAAPPEAMAPRSVPAVARPVEPEPPALPPTPPPAVDEDVLDLAMAQAEAEAVAEARAEPSISAEPSIPLEPSVSAEPRRPDEPSLDLAFEEPRAFPAFAAEPTPVAAFAPPEPDPIVSEPALRAEREPPIPMAMPAFTPVREPVARQAPRLEPLGPEPLAPEPMTPEQGPARAAAALEETLISREASEAVSSAFGSLAQAIFSREPRTIEDLTKDLLRPLLKQWLDDNLPSLVERLVREEIERVARGRR